MEAVYSEEIPHGIRLEVDGIIVVGTKKDEKKLANFG
jgi:hypothetical protein